MHHRWQTFVRIRPDLSISHFPGQQWPEESPEWKQEHLIIRGKRWRGSSVEWRRDWADTRSKPQRPPPEQAAWMEPTGWRGFWNRFGTGPPVAHPNCNLCEDDHDSPITIRRQAEETSCQCRMSWMWQENLVLAHLRPLVKPAVDPLPVSHRCGWCCLPAAAWPLSPHVFQSAAFNTNRPEWEAVQDECRSPALLISYQDSPSLCVVFPLRSGGQ